MVKYKKQIIADIVLLTILMMGAVTTLLPFIWMLSTSLDSKANVQLPFPPTLRPQEFSFNNYVISFKNIPMAKYFMNTGFVTAMGICVSVLSALLAGYSLSKINFKFKKQILLLCLATLMVPFEMLVIPMWKMFRGMGLLNSYWALVLPSFGWIWGAFLAKQFIDALPDSLRESAKIDGAREYKVFLSVYAPLCGPVIATLVIFAFMSNWNSFLWPLIVLNDPDKYLIQIGMALFASAWGVHNDFH
jgi:multiple sugar transport system permease protein